MKAQLSKMLMRSAPDGAKRALPMAQDKSEDAINVKVQLSEMLMKSESAKIEPRVLLLKLTRRSLGLRKSFTDSKTHR